MNETKIVTTWDTPNEIKLFNRPSNEILLFSGRGYYCFERSICELIANEHIIFYGAPYINIDGCKYRDASINEMVLVLNFLNKIYNEN